MDKTQILMERLKDNRGKKVIFLSHCLLNENTRYLGGACRAGCVEEIVDQCVMNEVGIVQLPCPEQLAWGGVIKRWLLLGYGSKGTVIYRWRRFLLPVVLWCTQRIYGQLARKAAVQIQNYQDVGYSVVAIVGIDGSPSCGWAKILDIWAAFEKTASIDPTAITTPELNNIIRQCIIDGSGLFIVSLRRNLQRRNLRVPILAHDMFAEMDGKQATLALPGNNKCTDNHSK